MNSVLLLLCLFSQTDADHSFASKTLEFILVEAVVTDAREVNTFDGVLELEIQKVGLGASSLVGKKLEASYECRTKFSGSRPDCWKTESPLVKGARVVACIRFSKDGPVIVYGWTGSGSVKLETGQALLSHLKALNDAKSIPEITNASFESLKKGCPAEHFVWGRICRARRIWSDDLALRISGSEEHPGHWRRFARQLLNYHRPEWNASDERRADLIQAIQEADDPGKLVNEISALAWAMSELKRSDAEKWREDFCKVIFGVESRSEQLRRSTIFVLTSLVRRDEWSASKSESHLVIIDAVWQVAEEARDHEFRQGLEDALIQAAEEGSLDFKQAILDRLAAAKPAAWHNQLKAAIFTPASKTGLTLKLPGASGQLETSYEVISLPNAKEARAPSRSYVIGEFIIASEVDSGLVETYVVIIEVVNGSSDWKGKRTATSIHPKPGDKGIRRWRSPNGGVPTPDWFDYFLNDHDIRCWEIDPLTGRAVSFHSLRFGEFRRAASRFSDEYQRLQRKQFTSDELRAKEKEWLQVILNQEELFWRRTESESFYASLYYRGAILHPMVGQAMFLLAEVKRTIDPEYFRRAAQNERYSLLQRAAFAGQAMIEQPSFSTGDVVRKLIKELSENGRSIDEAIALIYLLRNIATAQKPDQNHSHDLKQVLSRALDSEMRTSEYRLAIAHTMHCIASVDAKAIMHPMMLQQIAKEPPRQLDATKLPMKDTVSDAFFGELRMTPFFKDRADFDAVTAALKPEVRRVLEHDHRIRFGASAASK